MHLLVNLIPSPSLLRDPLLLNKVRTSADGDNLVCWIQQSGLINVLSGEGVIKNLEKRMWDSKNA